MRYKIKKLIIHSELLLTYVILVSLMTLPTSVYLLITSIILFLVLISNHHLKLNQSLKLYFGYISANIISTIQAVYTSQFLSLLGLIYLAPNIGGFIIYLLLKGKIRTYFKNIITLIYAVAGISGIHALFFPKTYNALGNVNFLAFKFKRNSLYSDVESTALATGLVFLFLAQSKCRIFLFGPLIDCLLVMVLVATTVSKSVLFILPLLPLLILDSRKKKTAIVFVVLVSALGYFTVLYGKTIYDYFADNGLSSFNGRIEKWNVLIAGKETFWDFLLGGGSRYVNIQGPFSGPHSFYVGTLLELGWLAIPAMIFIFTSIYYAFGKNFHGLFAVTTFAMTCISSEIIFNKFMITCLYIIFALNLHLEKSYKN